MDAPRVVVVGDVAVDVIARHTRPMVPGGDIAAKIRTSAGGAAANTAVWLAHHGVATTLVSRIGDDLAGERVRRELTAAGVRCVFAVDPVAPTGSVVALVDGDGQRSMLSDRGANARLRVTDLDPGPLAGAAHLHLSGYVLFGASRAAGVAALAAARAAGLTTSVDPQAAAQITDPAEYVELVRGVDLLLPNADEFAALPGVRDAVGAVAVTSGAAGATWIDRDTTVSVPAQPAECVDTTGAGDAFDAGLLTAWLAGAGPRDALLAGVRAGTLATTVVGAWPQPSIT